ncbi:MAG: hypothetical protein P8107_01540 [Spirochaetia bacterium]
MKQMTPQQLLSGNGELDVFDDTFRPDDEIIKQELYPPLPLTEHGLIWGFALARRARELGISPLPCSPRTENKPGERLRLALLLEDRAGCYTWEEKERILHYMEKNSLHASAADISLWVEKHQEADFITKIKRYRDFDPALRQLLEKGLVDFKTADRVSGLPVCLFQKLLETKQQFSFSNRRLLCIYILETIKRDGLSPSGAEKLIHSVFASPDPPAAAVRSRYPGLSALEQRFTGFKTQWLKGSGISLEAAPYFEGGEFRIQFGFRTPGEYAKRTDRLLGLKENIHELFNLLQ